MILSISGGTEFWERLAGLAEIMAAGGLFCEITGSNDETKPPGILFRLVGSGRTDGSFAFTTIADIDDATTDMGSYMEYMNP